MKIIRVSAPGKLILLGEHAAVYNKPAIISSVAKRCNVSILPRKDSSIKIVSETIKISEKTTEKNILAKTRDAREKWISFSKSNDITILKSITEKSLDFSVIALGEALLYYKKPINSGITLLVNSDVPIGSGMGSSASLAVAIAGAITLMLGKPFDKETINAIAYASEQKKHGFPSGGDNSACCFGGLVWYRRETPDFKIIQQVPFTMSSKVARNFLTVSTGIPEESTGEMVSNVRSLYNRDRITTETILQEQEALVRNLLTAMEHEEHDEIIKLLQKGESNLEKLGVVSPPVKKLIRGIEKTGGAAKICGGGGRTQGTGTVLMYHKNRNIVETFLKQQPYPHSEMTLGVEGVREEKN